MQIVCKFIPEGSVRRIGLVSGMLFALLLSLVLSVDRGLHSAFHHHSGPDSEHQHASESGSSDGSPCQSASCAAGAFDQGLVDVRLLALLVEQIIGWVQPHVSLAPQRPFLSLFVFLLPDRGPPSWVSSPIG